MVPHLLLGGQVSPQLVRLLLELDCVVQHLSGLLTAVLIALEVLDCFVVGRLAVRDQVLVEHGVFVARLFRVDVALLVVDAACWWLVQLWALCDRWVRRSVLKC